MGRKPIKKPIAAKAVEKRSKKDFRDKYFIKDIENITGIKAYTIRIWEARYGIIKPKRTDTKIRYYEEGDLKHMMYVSILRNSGIAISKIARMSRDEVMRKAMSINENSSKYQSQVQALSTTMLNFEEREFNKILSINILKLGMEETMVEIIFPFLDHVGLLWAAGSIHPAHEHFITNLIRQRLYVAIDQLNINHIADAKRYLLFVPSGEPHDLGLLFANYLLRSRGQNVIYLGDSTPIEDLHQIFKMHKPDYLFCALTATNSGLPTQVFIHALSKSWPNTTIMLTGPQVVRRKDLTIPKNCVVIDSPKSFINFVEENA